ncbi:DUF3970 family protein [uncultured Clostridium sp.]|uniref:DUF3970 family protein n=1 Tax=uncultured Clostridium sp. TaxID=59620 RepID=UPI0025DCCA6D|nr:DUF3970 family protein [uncultured Clostridium sp.]
MIKVRIEGKLEEINKAIILFNKNSEINILSQSEPYKNRGSNEFYRVYIDAEVKGE